MRKFLALFMSMLLFGLLATTAMAADASGQTVITMRLGSPNMTVNGEVKPIDAEGTTPATSNGRTMLPLRAVAEALGLDVEWDAASQTITLTGGAAANEIKKIGSSPAQTTTEKNVAMLKLNNGLSIPQVGIGTFSLTEEQAYTCKTAIGILTPLMLTATRLALAEPSRIAAWPERKFGLPPRCGHRNMGKI